MAKTIVVRLRRASQWDSEKPVREQAYWAEHARFMDALFAEELKEWTIFLDSRTRGQG
jgi:uncharacterized protein YqcC (DUF446 family)